MTAGLDTLVPAAGALGAFAGVLIALIRYLGHDRKQISEADKRYDEERTAHEETQRQLDTERKARRDLEDTLADTNRKLTALTEHVARLEEQIARLRKGST